MKKYTQGELAAIPDEIVERMLECQVEQGNFKDSTIFKNYILEDALGGGFDWEKTREGYTFWREVLNGYYNIFFQKYPKKSEYPKLMWVWNSFGSQLKRVVIMEKNGKFLAWANATTLEASERETEILTWQYGKDIKEPIPTSKVNITIEEIAKAFNISANQVSIVEKSA